MSRGVREVEGTVKNVGKSKIEMGKNKRRRDGSLKHGQVSVAYGELVGISSHQRKSMR